VLPPENQLQGNTMTYCETYEFFDEISALLKQLSDGMPLSSDQSKKLKKLLDRWDSIICPNEGCTQAKCPYAKPIDWVEYHGFTCLFDLIEHLDQRKKIDRIPERGGIDPLVAPWARRNGHYNP
jgi:hypothetical protein